MSSSDDKKDDGFKIEIEGLTDHQAPKASAPAPSPAPAAMPAAAKPAPPRPTPPPQRTSVPPRGPKPQSSAPQNATPFDRAAYGTFLARAAASLSDVSLVFAAFWLLGKKSESTLVAFALFAYNTIWIQSSFQATPGKMLFGLKVVDQKGEKISLPVASVRTLSSYLSSLIFCMGYLMAAFTSKKQTLHDRIANTFVITERENSPTKAFGAIAVSLFLLFKVVASEQANWRHGQTVELAGLTALDPNAEDSCSGKTYCVMTYVTPWCPACKASEPYMMQLRDHLAQSSRVGYKIVVGQDKPEAIEGQAKQLGAIAWMDKDGTFAQTMKINVYPTWLVWRTADKKIVSQPQSFATNRPLTAAEMTEQVPKHLQLKASEF